MPLFFASNAIYPISMMPNWLQAVSQVNPLTYEVDALRGLMIIGGSSSYGVGFDLLVLFVVMIALVIIGSKLYPKVVV
jgi:ABC-2 type transport system permease protein